MKERETRHVLVCTSPTSGSREGGSKRRGGGAEKKDKGGHTIDAKRAREGRMPVIQTGCSISYTNSNCNGDESNNDSSSSSSDSNSSSYQ